MSKKHFTHHDLTLGEHVFTPEGEGHIVDINPNQWDGIAVQVVGLGTLYYDHSTIEKMNNIDPDTGKIHRKSLV